MTDLNSRQHDVHYFDCLVVDQSIDTDFAFSLQRLTGIFEKALASNVRTEPSFYECFDYSCCLNEGDSDLVITALVRRSENDTHFRLDCLLDERRIANWKDIAAAHSHIADQDIPNVAKERRKIFQAFETWEVIAQFFVSDQKLEAVKTILLSDQAKEFLPDLHIGVEDRLKFYLVNILMPSKAKSDGLQFLENIFDQNDLFKDLGENCFFWLCHKS